MRYKLNNNELYIEIDDLGAGLTSLRDVHGTEYLWQGDPRYWKGQSPLLFPIVGALRGDRAVINGKEYTMPRHGLARISKFKPAGSSADCIKFRLDSNDKTREMYPFDFSLEVSFELTGRTLTQRFTVTNKGDGDMPFCLGCHPGFNIPGDPGDNFTDYVIKFSADENCDSPVIDPATNLISEDDRQTLPWKGGVLPLSHQLFYRDALVLENPNSRSVSMFSLVSSRGVTMDFDGFDYFGIWQAKDAPFVCLEPWTGTATTDKESDLFKEKRGMITLKKGESHELVMKITIL